MRRTTELVQTEATEINYPSALNIATTTRDREKFVLFVAAYSALVLGENDWAMIMTGEIDTVIEDEEKAAKVLSVRETLKGKEGYDVICWMLSSAMHNQSGKNWLVRLLRDMKQDFSSML
jgi:hypothetical protein